MDLAVYLLVNRIKKTAFAEDANITPRHFYQVLQGKYPFSKKLIKRIEEITGGEVTAEDLIPKKTVQVKIQTATSRYSDRIKNPGHPGRTSKAPCDQKRNLQP